MSVPQPIEELRRTLEDAGRQLTREFQEAQKQKIDPASINARERIVSESLESARNYYRKKEYARAFNEWERVCTALGGGEEFRTRIRALRESHENLARVLRESAEIKQLLNQRAGPSPQEAKFVEGAHEAVNGQVKKVYAYLSQQLRTERTARSLSFWWPVSAAVLLLVLGAGGLTFYHQQQARKAAVTAALAPTPAAAPTPVDDAFLQAQKNAAEQQIVSLKAEHQAALEDARRKGAEAARAERERIVQLETQLKEAEARNSELERRVEMLTQDNLNKDRAIAALN